jgi:hypothetical protein
MKERNRWPSFAPCVVSAWLFYGPRKTAAGEPRIKKIEALI